MALEGMMQDLCRQVRDDTLDAVLLIINPGDAPCDCISADNVGKIWMPACYCGNYDDCGRASAWCEAKNTHERIAALKASATL